MRNIWSLSAFVLAAGLAGCAAQVPLGGPSVEDSPAARGQAMAQTHCARCHAIDRTGESPFAEAPPFRTIPSRYPVDSLEEAFAEGIVVGHPAMPEFRFEPEQIRAILAYMQTLSPGTR